MSKFLIKYYLKRNILDIHVDKSGPKTNIHYESHSHDYCEIFFITSGKATQYIGNQKYDLRAGDLFVLKGSEEHSLTDFDNLYYFNIMFQVQNINIDDCSSLPGFWILFIHEQMSPFVAHMHLENEAFQTVLDLCNNLHREYIDALPGFASACHSYLIQLIVFLSRNFKVPNSYDYRITARLTQSIIYMQNNFASKISLDELADVAGFSKRHFNRTFLQNYGITPIQFLNDIRLNHARLLIESGDYTITQLADLCGFQDSNYFSKAFKQKYNISPSKFKSFYDIGP